MGNLFKDDRRSCHFPKLRAIKLNDIVANIIFIVAAIYTVWGAMWGFLFPKSLLDFLHPELDVLTRPYPILQSSNLLSGLLILVNELISPNIWSSRRCQMLRCLLYLPVVVTGTLQYQTTNAAISFLFGIILL